MPIIKSAIKRDRQANKRHDYNVSIKAAIRKQTKLVKSLLEKEDLKTAQQELVTAIIKLDRAAKKNVLHANTAARRKSQLTRYYNEKAKVPFGNKTSQATTKTTVKKPAKKSL